MNTAKVYYKLYFKQFGELGIYLLYVLKTLVSQHNTIFFDFNCASIALKKAFNFIDLPINHSKPGIFFFSPTIFVLPVFAQILQTHERFFKSPQRKALRNK